MIESLHTFFSVDFFLVQNPLLDDLLRLIVKDGSVLLELAKDLVRLDEGVVDDVLYFFLVFSNFGETFGGEAFFELVVAVGGVGNRFKEVARGDGMALPRAKRTTQGIQPNGGTPRGAEGTVPPPPLAAGACCRIRQAAPTPSQVKSHHIGR